MGLTEQETTELADPAPGQGLELLRQDGRDAKGHFVMDSLGRQHCHDAKGRFARKDGSVTATNRSKLTGAKDLLPGVDGRSVPYRRFREIVSAAAVDQGGIDQLSATRAQLVRRFAAASVLAEQLEVKIARGEEIDITTHATLSSTLVRLASRIGIDRVPKDVSPSLSDILRGPPP
jgi:hypothetical protein